MYEETNLDDFKEYINMLFLAKMLHDCDRFEIVTDSFFSELCMDNYYENIWAVTNEIFDYFRIKYYADYCAELMIFSNDTMEEYFILAGEYGKQHCIPEENNPHLLEAKKMVERKLSYSYSVDCVLKIHTSPKRHYHSRIGVSLGHDGESDPMFLAVGLIEIYQWFEESYAELRKIMEKASGAA